MSEKSVSALVLRLVANRTLELNGNLGVQIHAAFLDLLRQLDASLAQRLHDENTRKPYTTSFIWSSKSDTIREGDEAFVRFAILDPILAQLIIHQFLIGGLRQILQVAHVRFAITHLYTTSDGHSRAGNFALTPAPSSLFQGIQLHFLSPTAFSRKSGKTTVYDTALSPRNVWNYARRMWEFATGEEIGRTFDDWCEEYVFIFDQNLEKKKVEFKNYYVPGVSGTITYQLADTALYDSMYIWWCRLAEFMPYSSIGYKTTMGMGQVQMEILE